MTRITRSCFTLALTILLTLPASASDVQIRKSIAERLPNFPKIDEITKTPIPGIYELRIGTDVLYTDEQGSYLIEGQLIDTRTRANLTEQRITELTAIDFSKLPLKDAMVWKNGNGSRKMAVFADPNCGYCKKFERDLQQVKDVTVYTFLYPILGPDSSEKSRNIWCAKDSTKAWRDWMLEGTPAPAANCDVSALQRNTALGQRHRVRGTPGLVFEDGIVVPGALNAAEVETQLAAGRTRGSLK
jgi:thiol:disulfide interchange protein DsbC